jgi:hypothetical protein
MVRSSDMVRDLRGRRMYLTRLKYSVLTTSSILIEYREAQKMCRNVCFSVLYTIIVPASRLYTVSFSLCSNTFPHGPRVDMLGRTSCWRGEPLALAVAGINYCAHTARTTASESRALKSGPAVLVLAMKLARNLASARCRVLAMKLARNLASARCRDHGCASRLLDSDSGAVSHLHLPLPSVITSGCTSVLSRVYSMFFLDRYI